MRDSLFFLYLERQFRMWMYTLPCPRRYHRRYRRRRRRRYYRRLQ